jgi:hypothetical protein
MSRPEPEYLKSTSPVQRRAASSQSDPPTALLEAYKKHAEELRRIDDRQNTMIALLLGILSAAATLLIKEPPSSFGCPLKLYISLIAILIAITGHHATKELHDLRIAVRDLLVRCETALRFYEIGAFLDGKQLYTDYELGYPTKGGWLKQYYWIVHFSYAVFIALLWRSEASLLMAGVACSK